MAPHWAMCLVVFCAAGNTFGQLLLAKFSRVEKHNLLELKPMLLLTSGISVYVICMVLWIVSLRFLELNKAYAILSLSFIFVPLAAHYFLGEAISPAVIFGSILICLGVVIAAKGGLGF